MRGPSRHEFGILGAFGETADPGAHVPREATEAVLERLMRWSRDDGEGSTLAALLAPPGFGKTHLLRVLERRLCAGRADSAADDARSASGVPVVDASRRALYLPYAALSVGDIADWIEGSFGRASSSRTLTGATMQERDERALASLIERIGTLDDPFFLILDDAEAMPETTLRVLAKGLARAGSPLRIVLGLGDDSRGTRALALLDRLAPVEILHRSALGVSEVEAYLRARLERAGLGTDQLDGLDPATVRRIQALSGGVPRRIHRVVHALVEPDRGAMARALSLNARDDDWLGRPFVDGL